MRNPPSLEAGISVALALSLRHRQGRAHTDVQMVGCIYRQNCKWVEGKTMSLWTRHHVILESLTANFHPTLLKLLFCVFSHTHILVWLEYEVVRGTLRIFQIFHGAATTYVRNWITCLPAAVRIVSARSDSHAGILLKNGEVRWLAGRSGREWGWI